MPKALVIVESPAKAKTIAGYLGDDYVVESSVGHVRDLPNGAAEIPAAYKSESWARLGIDVDSDFKPLYVVPRDKQKQVSKLKKLLAEADELYVATDEDREGEAIAWHLLEVLSPGPGVEVKRMVFHEITPAAIREAVASPRQLDHRLVNAQEARRLLDRLYGFEVSPVLWKKVKQGLSAGRVQSVATRIVVERERERMAFVAVDYWDITGTFASSDDENSRTQRPFTAALAAVDGRKVASGRDFANSGQLTSDAAHLDEAAARGLAAALQDAEMVVRSVEVKPYRRRPAAPFMTSTFQQEAGRKLRLSSAMSMRAAQGLYEKGYITYMRTDSTTLSDTALNAARNAISERFGSDSLPDTPRRYANKSKNAQEAHEAIRPSGERFRSPEEVRREVPPMEADVYALIWQRTLASQMTDVLGETVQVRLGGTASDGRDAEFATSGTVITREGFRRLYSEDTDETSPDAAEDERRMPPMSEGDRLNVLDLSPDGHTTQPPARYTEASLVKRLEELGVGRPSTYASIMNTIVDRGYVWKKGTALVPTFTAFAVVGLLEGHFSDLVDYSFTARMEDDLDGIAAGRLEHIPWLTTFYRGDAPGKGLHAMVSDPERLDSIDAKKVNAIPLGTDADGVDVEVRSGRYGAYIKRGEDTANLPDDVLPDELTLERSLELLQAPQSDRSLGVHPETGLEVLLRTGRYGPYMQLGPDPDEDTEEKPKRASLLSDMTPETVTLEEAVQLLSLPRVVGTDPADGEEIVVQNGRYGPYLSKGKESRSLESEEQLFNVTLEECLKLLAQPPRRRGQPAAKPPLRELGPDPVTGRAMVVKDGRYGPYVTDGEANASLVSGTTPESLTVEQAAELLVRRRERMASQPKRKTTARRKPAAKKTSATKKKPAAKGSTAKKKPTGKAKTQPAADPAPPQEGNP